MYPPFWFSMIKSKKCYTHITGREIFKIITLGSLLISYELSYTISTLVSSASNIEGHAKLIVRLSSPSDQVIQCISHPSEE